MDYKCFTRLLLNEKCFFFHINCTKKKKKKLFVENIFAHQNYSSPKFYNKWLCVECTRALIRNWYFVETKWNHLRHIKISRMVVIHEWWRNHPDVRFWLMMPPARNNIFSYTFDCCTFLEVMKCAIDFDGKKEHLLRNTVLGI